MFPFPFQEMMGEFQNAAGLTLAGMTLRTQRELAGPWLGPWLPAPGGGLADRARALQRPWVEALDRVLEKHRATIEAQSRAGLQLVHESLRLAEARDPEQFRQQVEGLCSRGVESLRAVAEAQLGELRTAIQECCEASSRSLAAVNR